jgi:hypothetical protein
MARYLYDVNTLQRYIDVHKQFQGGLKTVDTDDSLKDIYLREAENVSLSEFNFIEKRYGTHKLAEHKPWTSLEDSNSPLQGYFEYYVDANTVHKIVAIEGQFYIDQGSGFQRVEFFTKEENTPFIDLTSLGIYTEDVVNTIATGSPFGTQLPNFCESTTDLLDIVGTVNGEKIYVFSNDSYYTWSAGFAIWQNPVTATDTYPASGFVQGEYYHDTRTNISYQWENASAKTGRMSANENIYKADFQKTRSVEGVRIDDKFYIATGTYPVYYKGDGKIYVLPQYEHSDLDLQNLSYNLNATDIETELNEEKSLTKTSSQGTTLDGITLEVADVVVKEVVKYPKIPHQLEGGKLTFKTAWHLFNRFDYGSSSNLSYWRYGPSYTFLGTVYGKNAFAEDISPGGLSGDYQPWGSFTSSGTPLYYTITRQTNHFELRCILYRKPAGTIDSFYESVVDRLIYTNNNASTGSPLYPTAPLFPTTSGATISNQEIVHNNPTSGFWDYKLQFVVRERTLRYLKNTDGSDNRYAEPQVIAVDTPKGYIEYRDIWVTPEQLTDYTEEPYTSLKAYSCNRITEHNGRLALFGHPTATDYIFFSTASAKEYFPYFYSIQFNNDLKEAINSITKFMNILVVQSDSYTWGLKGDAPLPLSALEGDVYKKITINPTIGCIAPYSVKNVRNQLYFLSKEGIFTLRALYAEDNRYNVDPIDRNIYNIVPRDTNAIAAYFDDQYWLHFPNSGDTLRYYVDKKAWVKDTYTPFNIFGGIFKYINESGKLRFITKLSQLEESEAFKIFDIEVDYSLPTDLTKNIVSKFTTSFLNQNYPFHLKNYKEAKFDFAIQNEYNTSNENLPVSNYAENSFYVQFDVDLIDRHVYSLTLLPTEVITPSNYVVEIDDVEVKNDGVIENSIPGSTLGNLTPITFTSNKTGKFTVKITIYELGFPASPAIITSNISENSIKLYDATYDHTVTFNTLVLSEEGTLNIDPIDSYTEADVQIPIDLGTRTGNWTFGTSNFGNVIVAIKTVKLAGRGYNNKVSVIEDSKSKWTLESLGITYKMKKARSR